MCLPEAWGREGMVAMMGFSTDERDVIRSLIDRFAADGHDMAELVKVERAEMPGYYGRVLPSPSVKGEGFDIKMMLACCNPFTIAHELGHIADIRARRQETRDHLSMTKSARWHLAHRMSSEYTANRVACTYVDEGDVFIAFQSDHVGLIKAVREQDWTMALISYALILGVFHGMGRNDCDPLRLLSEAASLPTIVAEGMAGFRAEAALVFEATWRVPVDA